MITQVRGQIKDISRNVRTWEIYLSHVLEYVPRKMKEQLDKKDETRSKKLNLLRHQWRSQDNNYARDLESRWFKLEQEARIVCGRCHQEESKSHYINCMLEFLNVKVKGKAAREKSRDWGCSITFLAINQIELSSSHK